MKASYSFPVLFLLAAACSDGTTAPPTGLTRTPSSASIVGEPPPPPVDAAVVVCAGECVVVEGSYFAKGGTGFAAALLQAAPTDGVCSFPIQAWLKFHKKQTFPNFTALTQAKGQVKCTDGRARGSGTIEFAGIVVHLDQVQTFFNSPDCTTFCASFTATATDQNGNEIEATGDAFNREFYDDVCGEQSEGVCNPGDGGGC